MDPPREAVGKRVARAPTTSPITIVRNGIEARLTGRIVDLDREVEIGPRTVHCPVEIRATATIGGEVHEVEVNVHRSNDVPGRVAREERRTRSDGREQTHVETVVEFESRWAVAAICGSILLEGWKEASLRSPPAPPRAGEDLTPAGGVSPRSR